MSKPTFASKCQQLTGLDLAINILPESDQVSDSLSPFQFHADEAAPHG